MSITEETTSLSRNQKKVQKWKNKIAELQEQLKIVEQQLQKKQTPKLPFASTTNWHEYEYEPSDSILNKEEEEEQESNNSSEQEEEQEREKREESNNNSNSSDQEEEEEEEEEEHDSTISSTNRSNNFSLPSSSFISSSSSSINSRDQEREQYEWVERCIFELAQEYRFIERVHWDENVVVYKVENKKGELCALKLNKFDEVISEKSPPLEIRILQELQPIKGVIRLLGWHILPERGTYAFVMPWIETSSIKETLFGNAINRKEYIYSLLETLQEIHEAGILYRDIKPTNVLWIPSTHSTVFIDFDCATYFQKEDLHTANIGTSYFMAPEHLKTIERKKKLKNKGKEDKEEEQKQELTKKLGYGMEIDVYAVGIVLAMILFEVTEEALINDHCTIPELLDQFYIAYESNHELPVYDLLKRLLEPLPELRITVEDALDHPYFYE